MFSHPPYRSSTPFGYFHSLHSENTSKGLARLQVFAAHPPLVSIPVFAVSLPLLDSVASVYGGAHPLAMDAHSGNVRGAKPNALAPARVNTHALPPMRARNPRRERFNHGDSLRSYFPGLSKSGSCCPLASHALHIRRF